MRILLADHHPNALWALKTMLEEKTEFEVTGEATNAESLLKQFAEKPPDLALIDWELPGKPIEDLIKALHAHFPRPSVVVMSSRAETSRMLLNAGADAFVSKSDQPEWLLNTLLKFAEHNQEKG